MLMSLIGPTRSSTCRVSWSSRVAAAWKALTDSRSQVRRQTRVANNCDSRYPFATPATQRA